MSKITPRATAVKSITTWSKDSHVWIRRAIRIERSFRFLNHVHAQLVVNVKSGSKFVAEKSDRSVRL